MKLRHLEILRAAARTGSLRGAAESLNTSQPALTKMVQQLENELDVQLLHRSIKGVKLTAFGKLVLQHSSSVFKQLDYLRDDLESAKGTTQEKISISVAPAVSLSILPRAFTKFSKRFPDMHLNVSGTLLPEALDDLLDGSLDCVIGTPTEEVTKRANSVPLFEVEVVVIATQNNPVTSSRIANLADLAEAQWFTAGGPEFLENYFRNAGVPSPRSTVSCESLMAMIALVAGSDGLGLAPTTIFESGFFPGVRTVSTDFKPEPRKIDLITRLNSEPKRSLNYLINCFLEERATP